MSSGLPQKNSELVKVKLRYSKCRCQHTRRSSITEETARESVVRYGMSVGEKHLNYCSPNKYRGNRQREGRWDVTKIILSQKPHQSEEQKCHGTNFTRLLGFPLLLLAGAILQRPGS